MPSQTIKSGATAVRGMPLRAMMIGSKISASSLAAAKPVAERNSREGAERKSYSDLLKSNPGVLEQVAGVESTDHRREDPARATD